MFSIMKRRLKKRIKARPTSSHAKILVLGCLLFAVVVQSQPSEKCPEQCVCQRKALLKDESSLQVECLQGGMHVIPVAEIDKNIDQLKIVPAPKNPNILTLTPLFNQDLLFPKLKVLIVVNSNVQSIGMFTFYGVRNLQTLNLTGNNLTSIEMDNFQGLNDLMSLHLDHNSIEKVPLTTFKHCTSLKQLSLSHNKISTLLPRLFRMQGKLATLDTSYNPLNDLSPDLFNDIPHLKIFKCRSCSLSRSNAPIFKLTPFIETLDLGRNEFKFLAEDEFNSLKNLKRLQLDRNQLSVIVDYLFGQNELMISLEIAHNHLTLLAPNAFINLTRLQILDISNNKLNKINKQTFAPFMNSLNFLDISGNHLSLKEISDQMQMLPEIEGLGLANLSLRDVPPKVFRYNYRLISLDISSNQLIMLPNRLLKRMKILQHLDISKNKIETLNEKELRILEAIPFIKLSDNPWNCDQCSIKAMTTYMTSSVLNGSLRHLRCYSPPDVRGVRLEDLTFKEYKSCSLTSEAEKTLIAGLVLLLVALLSLTIALCQKHCHTTDNTNEQQRRERYQIEREDILDNVDVEHGNIATIQINNNSW